MRVYVDSSVEGLMRTDRESGARRLVAEYGNRLYAAALFLCKNAAGSA